MKHLSIIIIVVSLCVFLLSIGVYHKVPWSVLPIVASGICILCWLLFHLLCISEERDLLKEGNQYFIDTFQNIRNPISLIKTPLGAVYEGDCPEDIKKELAVALHHIGGLEPKICLFTFPCNKRKQYIPDDDCRKAADSQEDEERNADKQENEACFIVFP